MRAVVQRVRSARVIVGDEVVGAVGRGLLVLLGVAPTDTAAEVQWLADKVVGLRIFADADGKMNRGVADVGGGVLVVSQFTLYGDCRKGRRPSFVGAAAAGNRRTALRSLPQRGQGARRAHRRRPLRRHDAGRIGQRRPRHADSRHRPKSALSVTTLLALRRPAGDNPPYPATPDARP